MIQNVENRVREYFRDYNWNSVKDKNGREVFFKDRNPFETEKNCFLNYSKQKNQRSFNQAIESLKKHFQTYVCVEPLRVISESAPFFITSGIQRHSPQFEGDASLQILRELQIQPVIRTNYRESAGEGNVSSFVNVSTIASPVSADQYVGMIDDWMEFFSSQGLFLPDFNITLKRKSPKVSENFWDANEGLVLSFSYGGLGIGDFGYIQLPTHPEEPIADLGIGLERLVWARNKNPSFGEVIGPLPAGFSPNMPYLDALRTLTLMAMSGVAPQSDAENQLRKYLPQIREEESPPIQEGISYYHNFWRNFFSDGKSVREVQQYLVKEINREQNLQVLRKIGHPKCSRKLQRIIEEDKGKFIQHLIESGFSRIDDLRSKL